MPTTAPPIQPDTLTVLARYPAYEIGRLTASAQGSVFRIRGQESRNVSAAIALVNQSTAAAVVGTEMLSSSLTGIVSTSAAAIAAMIGAPTVKKTVGAGVTAGRVHQASATPPAAAKMANAAVPARLFSAFHGSRGLETFFPTRVAVPSPSARMAQAAAAMSSGDGKIRISDRTASGYRRMPSGKPRA